MSDHDGNDMGMNEMGMDDMGRNDMGISEWRKTEPLQQNVTWEFMMLWYMTIKKTTVEFSCVSSLAQWQDVLAWNTTHSPRCKRHLATLPRYIWFRNALWWVQQRRLCNGYSYKPRRIDLFQMHLAIFDLLWNWRVHRVTQSTTSGFLLPKWWRCHHHCRPISMRQESIRLDWVVECDSEMRMIGKLRGGMKYK